MSSMQSGRRRKCSAVTSHCSDTVLVKWAGSWELGAGSWELGAGSWELGEVAHCIGARLWRQFKNINWLRPVRRSVQTRPEQNVFHHQPIWTFEITTAFLTRLNPTCLNGSRQTRVRYQHWTVAHVHLNRRAVFPQTFCPSSPLTSWDVHVVS